MEYEQALIIGKRRRADAATALGGYMRERAMEVCAVKPSKDAGLNARDWEPVGEESFKEIHIRRVLSGDREAYLLVVDSDGTANWQSTTRFKRSELADLELVVFKAREFVSLNEREPEK